MRKDIIKTLNLEGLWIEKIENLRGKTIRISAHSPRKAVKCPLCGKSTSRVHQERRRQITHGWWQGKTVLLNVKIRRFLCKNASCRKTFTESLPGIDAKHHTKACRRQALREMRDRSFSRTGKDLSTSPMTLIRWLNAAMADMPLCWPRRGELYLGIDGHSFSGRNMALTVTELRTKRTITVLPDDRQETLVRFLRGTPKKVKKRIRVVCIDMDSGLKGAIKRELPDATITADKFHVLRAAERALDEIRKIVQTTSDKRYGRIPKELLSKPKEKLSDAEWKQLEEVWERYRNFPSLYAAWLMKEKIRELYQSGTPKMAAARYEKILLILQDDKSQYLGELYRTLKRWQPYILSYFETGVTNAYTEGVHNPFKLIKRISFGFRNVHTYIAKIMLRFLPLYLLFQHHQLF